MGQFGAIFVRILLSSSLSLSLSATAAFAGSSSSAVLAPKLHEPISPLPSERPSVNADVAALGFLLFEDTRLSKNNTISCSTCHNLSHGGADNLSTSVGINGAFGTINTPTVFNSALNFRQFWDGRVATLEEQVNGPLQHPKEMGSRWDDVLAKISKDQKYKSEFGRLYTDGVTQTNVKNAIATFERSLITPNARFDRYLRGEVEALTAQEKKGYQQFKSFGCIACHQGTNVGGNMFQTMGVMGRYFEDRGTPITEADLGRFNVTKDEQDKFVFRVPSLRNVELTAPYFHDGSAKSLDDAVIAMAKFQLGRKLSGAEVSAFVAFLKSLTGEVPRILVAPKREAASK
ncbi:hypothetical protein BH10BDE1_BH10BDE1_02090 [soil metagenome]